MSRFVLQPTSPKRPGNRPLKTLGVLLLLAVVIWVTLQWIPTRLVGDSSPEQAKSLNDVRIVVIQTIGGVVLVFGLIFTARTFLLIRRTERSSRFSKSLEMLATSSESVRIGAVYSLAAIAREDAVAYWEPVDEVLCTFVKERSSALAAAKVSNDTQAALSTIGSLPHDLGRRRRPVQLAGIDLSGAILTGANLENANLRGTKLSGADFTDAILKGANISGNAQAVGVNFSATDLRNSDLSTSNFTRSNFYKAQVSGTKVEGSDMTDIENLTSGMRSSMRGTPAAI